MKTKLNFTFILFLISVLFFSCGDNKKTSQEKNKSIIQKSEKVFVPDFNADSAYYFVAKQVEFGPRVPGSEANAACAKFLENTLKRFSPDVTVQNFKARIFNGTILNGKNIIASFNPEIQSRIFLCAHWDSRPFADHDSDKNNFNKPIDGANDGASGVGVLLEIARQLKVHQPKVGIDIILFDMEDYGTPQSLQSNKEDTWALGSQYWSKNPHKINYRARYGILLDMVGASDATFTMEGTSMYYAPDIMKKVWDVANKIGYQDYFIYNQTNGIIDDHYYINDIINIPTIDIIHHDPNTRSGFFKHWHTIHDNIDVIDPATLKVVGQTVLTVIFEER